MIIDAHRHMWSASERHHGAFIGLPGRKETAPPRLDWEKAASAIVEEMDSAGVAKSIVFVADFSARLGDAPFSIADENRFIVEAGRQYPDRLVPFYGIDPRRPGAAADFAKAIRDWKVRGLKLHPAVGFFPHDRICYPLYELCSSHGLPVLFHCGLAFHPKLYNRYSHPLEFDHVATDFPSLDLIMGHAGHDWWTDCVAVARNHPRMFLELSEWQPAFVQDPQEVLFAIHKMRNALGAERIVWGSDFPGLRRWMPLKEWAETFRRLPELGKPHGYPFTAEETEAILGGNVARILKLSGPS